MLRTLFIVLLNASLLHAGVEVSSPARGYYRVGRYLPLRVSGVSGVSGGGGIEIRGEGLLPVRVIGDAHDVVVPMLVLDRPGGEVTVGGERVAVALKELAGDERLVGLIGANVSETDARAVFPGKSVMIVPLDPARPLRGTPAAWEALDGIVSDAWPIAGVDDAALRWLRGGGVTVAVRSANVPDETWPWRREGSLWVLWSDPLGPRSAVGAGAYGPVLSWSPGATAGTRARVVVFAVLCAVALLAATLLRRRTTVTIGVVAVAVVATGAIHVWSRRLPAQRTAQGTVAVFDRDTLQHDFWTWTTTPHDARTAVRLPCIRDERYRVGHRVAGKPVFALPAQAARQEVMLTIDGSNGEPIEWSAVLGAREKLAVMSRVIDPRGRIDPHPLLHDTDSPMQVLVRDAYLGSDVRVLGQGARRTDVGEGFAEVYVERKNAER